MGQLAHSSTLPPLSNYSNTVPMMRWHERVGRTLLVLTAASCALSASCGGRTGLGALTDAESRTGNATSGSSGLRNDAGQHDKAGQGGGGGTSAGDACLGGPCRNGGVCRSEAGQAVCTCARGYVGARCETNVNDCEPSPCQHGGTCVDEVATYACHCPRNFTGKNCELQQFTPLGVASLCQGQSEPFVASHLSGDGRVLVGSCQDRALRWTASGGFQIVLDHARAFGTNWDGSVVVGTGSSPSGESAAFRWTAGANGVDYLPAPSSANATNGDGSVVVGEFGSGDARRAYRWLTPASGPPLTLPTGTASGAYDVSALGDVIVGWTFAGGSARAFRWTAEAGAVNLGVTPNTEHSIAIGVSRDGSTVVGNAFSFGPVGDRGFVWTRAEGMRDPGLLPGFSAGVLRGTDGHGAVALGFSRTDSTSEAMLWDEEHGVRSVGEVLVAAGADVAGWKISGVAGISDDGTVIGGTGYNPRGDIEAWLSRLR